MGFEPTTSRATTWHSNQLSYTHHMARLEGLEPTAHGLEGRCSIQLSYRRMPQDGFLRRKIGAFRGNLPFPLTDMHYITVKGQCQPIFTRFALTKTI